MGWNISGLARLNDPRFSGDTYTHEFKNFFNGKASVPSLIMPTLATATGFPTSYAKLQAITTSCAPSKWLPRAGAPATSGRRPRWALTRR